MQWWPQLCSYQARWRLTRTVCIWLQLCWSKSILCRSSKRSRRDRRASVAESCTELSRCLCTLLRYSQWDFRLCSYCVCLYQCWRGKRAKRGLSSSIGTCIRLAILLLERSVPNLCIEASYWEFPGPLMRFVLPTRWPSLWFPNHCLLCIWCQIWLHCSITDLCK